MLKSEFFDKNIKAMKMSFNAELGKKLGKIKEAKKFDLIFNKDPLNLNIIELKTREKIYENPLKELEEKLKFIDEKGRLILFYFFTEWEMAFYIKLCCKIKHIKKSLFLKRI